MHTNSPLTEQDKQTAIAVDMVAGLRALADFVETNPHLADDLRYSLSTVIVPLGNTEDPRARMAAFARAAGKATKNYDTEWAHLDIRFSDHVSISPYAHREQICERVVTGTREETREVPDPEMLAAVPTVSVTETVEDVEWVCHPLLAAEPASA